MRVRRLLAWIGVAIGLGARAFSSATPAVGGAAPVKSVGVPLPVDDFAAIELDEARGRLYLAQGVGAGLPLVVTDLDGRLVRRIAAVTDVSDLALSADGTTLYVAQGLDRITALDAATLTVTASYPAPAGACVYTVEPAGAKIVGGYADRGSGSGGLLVWSAPETEPVGFTDGPDHLPVIDASPGTPGLVVAGDAEYSPVTTYVIDVSGASPTIVGRRDNTGSNLLDYAVSPDGTEVVEAVGHPYAHHSYRLPDLADATVYSSGAYPQAAAWSADSSTVAIGRTWTASGESDVFLYDRGGTVAKYAVDFRDGDNLWRGTLLVNHDGTRAWAVSSDDVYQRTQLLHSFGPGHPPAAPVTDLAVTARVGTGEDGSTAQLTLTWSSPVGNDEYWWITASTDGGAEREFGRGTLNGNGKHTLGYDLPRGTTTFTVRYRDVCQFYPDGFATAAVQR